jgi:hypothetical protein
MLLICAAWNYLTQAGCLIQIKCDSNKDRGMIKTDDMTVIGNSGKTICPKSIFDSTFMKNTAR